MILVFIGSFATFKIISLKPFPPMRSIFTLVFLSIALLSISQTPVRLLLQPNLSYTENFSDIKNWQFNPANTGDFIAGIGSSAWKGLTTTATGPIPNGAVITQSSTVFSTSFFQGTPG
jgi:hypothetical protein